MFLALFLRILCSSFILSGLKTLLKVSGVITMPLTRSNPPFIAFSLISLLYLLTDSTTLISKFTSAISKINLFHEFIFQYSCTNLLYQPVRILKAYFSPFYPALFVKMDMAAILPFMQVVVYPAYLNPFFAVEIKHLKSPFHRFRILLRRFPFHKGLYQPDFFAVKFVQAVNQYFHSFL